MKLIPKVYHDHTGQGRFKNSFRLCWTALWSAILLQILALWVAGPESMPVLTVSIPTMLALAGAWSGITNWAEIRGVDAGFPAAPPDMSKQTVNVNPVQPPETEK